MQGHRGTRYDSLHARRREGRAAGARGARRAGVQGRGCAPMCERQGGVGGEEEREGCEKRSEEERVALSTARVRPCFDQKKTQKNFTQYSHHIESLDVCMEH
jgi:hypothetical protein